MSRFNIGDIYFSLPILLDKYNDILDVTECTLSGRNRNSAGEDERSGSKGNHFQLT